MFIFEEVYFFVEKLWVWLLLTLTLLFTEKSLLLDPRHDIIVRIYIFWFLQKIVIYFICNISGLCFKNMWVFENQSTFFNVASFTTINETHICSPKYLLGFLQHYLSTVKLFLNFFQEGLLTLSFLAFISGSA